MKPLTMREIAEQNLLNDRCNAERWNVQAQVAELVEQARKSVQGGGGAQDIANRFDVQVIDPLVKNPTTAAQAIGILATVVAFHEIWQESHSEA